MQKLSTSFVRSIFFVAVSLFLSSCSLWNIIVPSAGGGAFSGNFSAQVIECFGNAGNQEITVVLMMTNVGFNEKFYVGGSLNGTMAVDVGGNTLKPHSSTGNLYEFPTGVPVRVTIERISPIMAGTPMLRTLRVNIGTSKNIVEFRNVPIAW